MKDINISEPVTVTMRAVEWYWLLGVLSASLGPVENSTVDKVYDQVYDATQ